MVFCSLFRQHRFPGEVKFFQSSYPYLTHNSSSVTKFKNYFYTRFYVADDPHPSRQHAKSFLGIDAGHYGVYFTIFNHDGDRKKARTVCIISYDPILSLSSLRKPVDVAKFYISHLNQDIVNNILDLKSKSRSFLSTSAFGKRAYSTSTRFAAIEPVEADEFDSFAHSQVDRIVQLHARNDLNLIYPIYQSLKRNDIELPSVALYNAVLQSILARPLDSGLDHESIELKLTNLLTVYQDLLQCRSVRPDTETFNLVVNGLLDGSARTIELYSQHNVPQHLYHDCFIKSQEFCLIGVELLQSIKQLGALDLDAILPKLLAILNAHPNLINAATLDLVTANAIASTNPDYYVEAIKFTTHLRSNGVLAGPEDAYNHVLALYTAYTTGCGSTASDAANYSVYGALVQALIETDNFGLATQFLDSILVEFKHSKDKLALKPHVSALISTYLHGVELQEACVLLNKFNAISYIPELPMDLYNGLINKLVLEYYRIESEKTPDTFDQLCLQQRDLYEQVWHLTDYNIIRKDFKLNENLISLAVDLNDYNNVYKITKCVLTNDVLIQDPNVFQKLIGYYYHGMQADPNNFLSFYETMFNLIEHQADFYGDYKKLNTFLSEYHQFFLVAHPAFAEYLFKTVVNSSMVNNAFEHFTLGEDNLAGLVAVSQYLIAYTESNKVSETDLLRVMDLQSCLINEFENPEAVYLSLDEGLQQFKTLLINNFSKLSGGLAQYTSSIVEACRYLDLEIRSSEVTVSRPEINLNLMLNINYDMGVDKFVELFRKGNSFNYITMLIIINKNFLVNYVLNDAVNVKNFVKMIVQGDNSKHLLNLLIKQNLDKINIQVLKQIKGTALEQDQTIVDSLLGSAKSSDNKYLHKILLGFNLRTTPKYLSYLESVQNFEHLSMVFSQRPDLAESNTTLYLKTLLNTNQLDSFNQFIRQNYQSREAVQELLKDDDLKTLVNEYYFVNDLDQQLPTEIKEYKSVDDLSSQIFLQLNNKTNLQKLVNLNARSIKLHQQAVLHKLLNELNTFQLSFKYLLQFCKVSGINKLSVLNFNKVITMLTATNQDAILNIILSKFISGSEIADYLNFYFMEVLIIDSNDKLNVLTMLRDSFAQLGNTVNVNRIDTFLNDNGLYLRNE